MTVIECTKHYWQWNLFLYDAMNENQWRIHVGVHGGRDPPFESPIFSICTKRPFCRFLNFFSTPNIKEVMPVFAPKSAVLHHCFQKNFRMEQMHSECRKMHRFAWRFQKFSGGDTPVPPLGQGASALHIRASSPQRASGFVGPPLSKVAGSAPERGQIF